jgi:hypothetical protein
MWVVQQWVLDLVAMPKVGILMTAAPMTALINDDLSLNHVFVLYQQRIPVGLCCSSRYTPSTDPIAAAEPSRKIISVQSSLRVPFPKLAASPRLQRSE